MKVKETVDRIRKTKLKSSLNLPVARKIGQVRKSETREGLSFEIHDWN